MKAGSAVLKADFKDIHILKREIDRRERRQGYIEREIVKGIERERE